MHVQPGAIEAECGGDGPSRSGAVVYWLAVGASIRVGDDVGVHTTAHAQESFVLGSTCSAKFH